MSITWGGSYNSLRLGRSHLPAARVNSIRRLFTTRRRVATPRHASLEFSPLAHGLRELERIQIASPGYGLPVEPVGATGGALTSPRVRGSQPDAGATTRPRSARNGRRLA